MCTGTNIHIRHCWNHLVLRRIKSTGGNTAKRDYHLIYEIKMIWSNQNLLYMRRSYIDQMQTNWNIFGGGMLGGSSEDGIHFFSFTTLLQTILLKKKPRDKTTTKPATSPKGYREATRWFNSALRRNSNRTRSCRDMLCWTAEEHLLFSTLLGQVPADL